jgi:hypothetical protein
VPGAQNGRGRVEYGRDRGRGSGFMIQAKSNSHGWESRPDGGGDAHSDRHPSAQSNAETAVLLVAGCWGEYG